MEGASLASLREKWEGYRVAFPEQVSAFEKQNGGDVLERAREIPDEDEAADYLADCLNKLRKGIASSNSSKEFGGAAVALGCVLQALGGQFGLMLHGPAGDVADQMARNEEAYSNLVKECVCKYGGSALLEPEARLALLTLACVGSVHTRNAAAARLAKAEAAGARPPPPEPQTCPPAPRPDNVAPPGGIAVVDVKGIE